MTPLDLLLNVKNEVRSVIDMQIDLVRLLKNDTEMLRRLSVKPFVFTYSHDGDGREEGGEGESETGL